MMEARQFVDVVDVRDEEEEEKSESIGWEPAPRGEIMDPLGFHLPLR